METRGVKSVNNKLVVRKPVIIAEKIILLTGEQEDIEKNKISYSKSFNYHY